MTLEALRDRLMHGLIPAVPLPCRVDGTIDWDAQSAYAAWMAEQPIAGVAVWAHTGRGLMLGVKDRERVLSTWCDAMPDKIVIAGAGGPRDALNDDEYLREAENMAHHARSLGADALLCYAPSRFVGREDADDLIVRYHERLAETGLPMLAFYLYEAAGGISYSPTVLRRLFAIPEILGIKMATLDSVMTYQDVSRIVAEFPDKLFVTGEDRFLGYSLMRGARAALIGMGSAATALQAHMMNAYYTGDLSLFHELSLAVDALAECTFVAPMEGYIGRMLYLLAKCGVIPFESAHDPWGPTLHERELSAIDSWLEQHAQYFAEAG